MGYCLTAKVNFPIGAIWGIGDWRTYDGEASKPSSRLRLPPRCVPEGSLWGRTERPYAALAP